MNTEKATMVTEAKSRVDIEPWGKLVWFVSGPQHSSETMTVGRCHIAPARENPLHFHPNCDEVLHLLQGTLEHYAGGELILMNAGDTISIPAKVLHNARNIGTEEAIMVISFSSAYREAVGE